MYNKNINIDIKSIDDLKREAINGRDITRAIEALVRVVESETKAALRTRESHIFVPILYCQYSFDYFSATESVKILTYNLIKILENKNYVVKLNIKKDGYYVIINLDKYCGKSIDNMLDTYLNQYSISRN